MLPPPPHLSVQLQLALISTVSLQREPLKGRGWMAAAAATEPPTPDLSKTRGKERVKEKASAGRTSHNGVLQEARAREVAAAARRAECHVVSLLS